MGPCLVGGCDMILDHRVGSKLSQPPSRLRTLDEVQR